MKYKKRIVTGALALSLLVGGSSVFAFSPQDLGIKKVQQTYQKQNKDKKKIESKKQHNRVGIVSAVNSTGFTMDVKNKKAKTTSSVEVKTDVGTIYNKNGKIVTASDLVVGQKVIVVGTFDKATNILTAQKVKIVTKVATVNKEKKGIKVN
ncbi:MAG: hypothetical protein WC839_00445 [Candidatus Paceibacterota bacterium]